MAMTPEETPPPGSPVRPVFARAVFAAALAIGIYLLWPVSAPPPVELPAPRPPVVLEKAPPAPPGSPPIPPPPPAHPPEPVIDESLLPQEREEAERIMKNVYQMHQALFAYAQSNDQNFPEGQTANEAMRELFIKGLVDDERLFAFSGLGIPEHPPDGNIGTSDEGYSASLSPGECDVSYNPGMTSDRDNANNPLLWYQTKAPSGMHYLVLVRISGSVQVHESRTGKFPDPERKDGREILSPENGVDPAHVLHPEVPEQR